MRIVEDDAFIAVAPESSSIPSDEDEREDLRVRRLAHFLSLRG